MSIRSIKESPLCPTEGEFEAEVEDGVWETLKVSKGKFELRRYCEPSRRVSGRTAAQWYLQHGIPKALSNAILREAVTTAILDAYDGHEVGTMGDPSGN